MGDVIEELQSLRDAKIAAETELDGLRMTAQVTLDSIVRSWVEVSNHATAALADDPTSGRLKERRGNYLSCATQLSHAVDRLLGLGPVPTAEGAANVGVTLSHGLRSSFPADLVPSEDRHRRAEMRHESERAVGTALIARPKIEDRALRPFAKITPTTPALK